MQSKGQNRPANKCLLENPFSKKLKLFSATQPIFIALQPLLR
jgi:hypothetical protein